jgi:peptidoglycan/xylan/chitin deacetylase (PgdA/CDA1 family)
VAPAAAIAAGFGFVLSIDAQHATSGRGDVALAALSLLAGALAARHVTARVPLRVTSGLVALVAAWLLPQRADIGSALILAALFGAAAGLIAGPRVDLARTTRVAILPVVVLCAARAIASQDVLVAVSAALVVVAAVSVEDHDSADGTVLRRRGAMRATATILIVATAVFAMYVGSETESAHWFGGGITRGPTVDRDVALTFDDGPNLTATLPIMHILDAAHIKATFFEVGHAIDKVPWITQDLYKDGQGLGNHSYHHDAWRWLDPFYPELQRTQDMFQRSIGICPAYYRPPHGDRTPFDAHVVSDHHMRIIMWDDSAGDWAVTNPRTIAQRILRGVKPGSIIDLHDGLNGDPLINRTALVKALPLILAGLRKDNLHPVRLDQLIGGPAFIPCH